MRHTGRLVEYDLSTSVICCPLPTLTCILCLSFPLTGRLKRLSPQSVTPCGWILEALDGVAIMTSLLALRSLSLVALLAGDFAGE